jgi:hypothetical protein
MGPFGKAQRLWPLPLVVWGCTQGQVRTALGEATDKPSVGALLDVPPRKGPVA